jgi:quinoprotein glucose dehydrogenase
LCPRVARQPSGQRLALARSRRGGQRFSPLKQITPSNVARLQTAWTFDTGATGIQVTPLVINGIMYVAAGKDILALEPETAKVIWKYTAPAAVSRAACRLLARRSRHAAASVQWAGDRLLAVDAERGKPAAGFGDERLGRSQGQHPR